MSENNTHQYIFEQETGDYFYDFLESFHESFIGDMIMTGAAPIEEHVENVKMVTMDNEEEVCKQMLGGMLKFTPFIHIRYADHIVCNVYALRNDHINGVFMSQKVHDFPKRGHCLWSFWRCDNDLDAVSDIL